jgi:WD40 repeat protein
MLRGVIKPEGATRADSAWPTATSRRVLPRDRRGGIRTAVWAVMVAVVAAATAIAGVALTRSPAIPAERPVDVFTYPFDVTPGSLAFSPNGQMLAGTDARCSGLRLWSVASRRQIALLPFGSGWRDCGGVAFSPDGETVVAFGLNRNGRICRGFVWNIGSYRRVATLRDGLSGQVTGAAFSATGSMLAAVDSSDHVEAWDMVSYRPVTLRTPGLAVRIWLEGSKTIRMLLHLWSLPRGPVVATLTSANSPAPDAIAFVGEGSGPRTVRAYSVMTGRLVAELTGVVWTASSLLPGSLALGPDGRNVAEFSYKANTIVRLGGSTQTRLLVPRSSRVNGVTFSPGGSLIAGYGTGGPKHRGQILLWHAPTR